MKRKMILFLVLVLLFLVLLTNCLQGKEKEQIKISGFVNGNRYLEYTENNKINYVQGLMDMFLNQIYFYNPKLYSDIDEATNNMTLGQIRAIFERYLEKHPEEWHLGAASLFDTAIREIVGEK